MPGIGIGVSPLLKRGGGTDWSSYWATRWYGIEIDEAETSPDVTRIEGADASGFHATLPVQSLMKGCLLNDNGTVNYYLDPTDWSKKADGTASKLDGTDGQVMIEIPTYYRKVDNPSAGVYQIKICEGPATGFAKIPKFYIGAYEAALDRTNHKLASVKNTSEQYRGGNNNAAWDGADNSLLGKPASTIALANFRIWARNRGSVNWNLNTWKAHNRVIELFFIEHATLNGKKAVDATLTAEGYKKGGLGNGVTTTLKADWATFSKSYPFIPCGASDSLANGTGEAAYIVAGWPGGDKTVYIPRYRGIENLFGHMLKYYDGAQVYSDPAGGTAQFYICDNPNNFIHGNVTNYTAINNTTRASGWIKTLLYDSNVFVPSINTGGSGATYFCSWLAWYSTAEGYAPILGSGDAGDYGVAAGLMFTYYYSFDAGGSAATTSRLMYLTEW